MTDRGADSMSPDESGHAPRYPSIERVGASRAPDDDHWCNFALRTLENEQRTSVETGLVHVRLPAIPKVDVYLKDEGAHPTGSLKHRLARSLLSHAICSGRLTRGMAVVEASSGSTAISEAYFCRLLELPFVAVMPRGTSMSKIDAVVALGGTVRLVDSLTIYAEAEGLAKALGGVYLDQFTHAERAADWKDGNLASSLFDQVGEVSDSPLDWIVVGVGTGGTAATIGRHIRYKGHATRLCVVDVEHSAYFDGYGTGDRSTRCEVASRIEGVGRPRIEPSFVPGVIDRMVKAPDCASIGAMRLLAELLGRSVGPSTGANFLGVCTLALEMQSRCEVGAIASLICDRGDRYAGTYDNDAWLKARGLECASDQSWLRRSIVG